MNMTLRILILISFLVSIFFPFTHITFASETTFSNPTFGDISSTAVQSGGINNSDPIAGNSAASSEQYCKEKGMYFAYYTVGEPSPFGPKASFNTLSGVWDTTSGTTKSVSKIICSSLPIVGLNNGTSSWSNNYWDTNFPGFASGSLNNIKIKARVNPSLNMAISTEEIDLGVLVAGVPSTGSLFLEVGTNAKSGVSITARSQSGGLTHTTDAGTQINDLTTDGLTESYTWESTPNATDDSASAAFAATGLAALEVNDDTTEHTVYNTNKAESTNLVDDVEFIVSATTSAETPAGDYEDYVIFTVTGNF